jgi:DNA-directed RNA polymerase subunit RPC12/RpoP
MAKKFDCPSCGAGLDYDGDDDHIVRCAYCGSAIIVPAELRPRPPQSQSPVVTRNGRSLTIDLRGLPDMASKIRAVKQLLVDGQLPEAARVYQAGTGISAEESAAAVQRLAAGQSLVVDNAAVGTSIPVVSGSRVVSGTEATDLVRKQLGAVLQQQRRVSRVVTCVVIGAVLLSVAVFLLLLLGSGVIAWLLR